MRVKGREIARLRNRIFAWLRVLAKQGKAVKFTRITCLSAVSAAQLLRAIRPKRGTSYFVIVAVAPASLGAPHVHILHTGKVRCALPHERHEQDVREGVSSSKRLALYVAKHLAQKPMDVARSYRASQDFPQEQGLNLPPVLAGVTHVEGHQVQSRLYWYALANGLRVSLRIAVRVRGEKVYLGEDVGVFLCSKTNLYWPDLPKWRAKDNPRSSQHWRMCQDAARHANARAGEGRGQIVAHDVLRLSYRQRFRCYWCERSLLTSNGPAWHLDHMRPLSNGGENAPANLCLCCPRCNRSKSRLSPLAFAYRLAARGVGSVEVRRLGIPVQMPLWRRV